MKRTATLITAALSMLGCTPHIYDAGILILDAEEIEILSLAKISDDCISSEEVPQSYRIEKDDYTLLFEVKALQVGLKIKDKKNLGFFISPAGLRTNDVHTGIDPSYLLYFSTLEENDTLIIDVMNGGELHESESISVRRVNCKAMTIDAI